VSETSESYNTDLLSLAASLLEDVTVQRREGGDTGTQERSNDLEADALGHLEAKVFIHSDLVTVATRGHVTFAFLVVVSLASGPWSRVGLDTSRAVLFQIGGAKVAIAAASDQASNTHFITNLEIRHGTSNGTNDFSSHLCLCVSKNFLIAEIPRWTSNSTAFAHASTLESSQSHNARPHK
jgi:hypothetical protein